MLAITFQILELVSFVALLVLFWRVSGWPRWRVRVIVYGWALVFAYSIFWAAILPMGLRGIMDSQDLVAAFPDGTIAAAALFGSWFWPMIVVVIRGCRDRKKMGNGDSSLKH